MLDELIEKHFTKLEEIEKLEGSIKELKEDIKKTKKIVSEADASLARLMKESKHESFLFQKDGKNLIVYSNGDDCVSFEEIPTIQDMKKELAIGRMLQGSKNIIEQENTTSGYHVNGLPVKKKTTLKKKKNPLVNSWLQNSFSPADGSILTTHQIKALQQVVGTLNKR